MSGVENLYSAQGERSHHVPGSVCSMALTRQLPLIVTPLLSLEVATSENKSTHSTLSSICMKTRLISDSC